MEGEEVGEVLHEEVAETLGLEEIYACYVPGDGEDDFVGG